MKNRFTLMEVGSSFLIFGLSMILFPNIFNSSNTHQSNDTNSLFIEGSVLVFIGLVLLTIRFYKERR